MIEIHPLRIAGRWREGFALDVHTTRSVYLGEDEFGQPQYDTERSPAGELLFQLKYRSDQSAVAPLVEVAGGFVRGRWPAADVVVPVPPSRPRPSQPVLLLGEAIAQGLGVSFLPAAVRRQREVPELKDVRDFDERLRLLDGAHAVDAPAVQGRRVLLFDDLFRSGATMNAIAAALYDEGRAEDVVALTITRTRSNR